MSSPEEGCVEITVLTSIAGPITKALDFVDDKIVTKRARPLWKGKARRCRVSSLPELANLISAMRPEEALTLGRLRSDQPSEAVLTTKDRLQTVRKQMASGGPWFQNSSVVTRTTEYFVYKPGAPAFAVIDVDVDGMPPAIQALVEAAGGFWNVLCLVLPQLVPIGHVIRPSTRTFLSRTDTEEKLPGSQGEHIYVPVEDGADIVRFIHTLHDRLFLAGYGWHVLDDAGQPLERSIVDRVVGGPERIVYEGAPVLTAALRQDHVARAAIAFEGGVLDSFKSCPPLSSTEAATCKRAKDTSAAALRKRNPHRSAAGGGGSSNKARMMGNRKLADGSTSNVIDIATAKVKLAPLSAEVLLVRFCPDGKVDGGEFIHPDPLWGGSIKFGLRTHLWKNWKNDLAKGSTVESFIAHALQQDEAAIREQVKALGGVEKTSSGDETMEIMVPPRAPLPNELKLLLGADGTPTVPTATWGYRSATGQILMVVARYPTTNKNGTPGKRVSPWLYGRRIWTSALGRPCNRVGWHAKGHPEPRPLYGQEWLAKSPKAPVIICEGEKAVDAVPKLLKGYIGTTSSGGAKSAKESDWAPIFGRDTIIWPDNDEPGLSYAKDVNLLVQAAGAASVRQVEVPTTWPEGWDLADGLPPGVTPADLLEMIRTARQPKTVIHYSPSDLHIMVDQAEAAIIASGEPVFQRGHTIVRPTTTPIKSSEAGVDTLTAALLPMNQHALRDVLSKVTEWVSGSPSGKLTATAPPKDIASTLLSREGKWHLPPIAGIVSCPTIRPDGSLLMAPGYDEKTRLYHEADPNLVVVVKDNPTRADAMAALKLLEGLYAEVAFVTDGGVSKSVALASLITLVCRGAMNVVPLTLFRAHTSSTGKSYLVNIHSNVATGRSCPVISVADKPEETEKRITGALLGGFPLISLDNVNGEIKSDLLCQAVEQDSLRLRPLGASDMVDVENTFTFVITGNNAKLVSDLIRRALLCGLDAITERPDQRVFTQDPIAMVRANRGRYVAACLTIVRAYVVAGFPGDTLKPMSSYGQWSKFIRGPLIWLGQPDPADSIETVRADDPELTELETVIAAFDAAGTPLAAIFEKLANPDQEAEPEPGEPAPEPEPRKPGPKPRKTGPKPREAGNGFSIEELLGFFLPVVQNPNFAVLSKFRDLLQRIAPGRDGTDPKKLGRWFSKFEGRVVGLEGPEGGRRPLRIIRRGMTRTKAVLWAIEEPKAGERQPLSVVHKRKSPTKRAP